MSAPEVFKAVNSLHLRPFSALVYNYAVYPSEDFRIVTKLR